MLGHYSIAIAVGYGFDFDNSRPQPINLNTGNPADLEYNGGVYLDVGTDGEFSEPSVAAPSYHSCLNDTVYTKQISGFTTGTVICYTGHGVIAGVLITTQPTEPIQSLTFEGTVWKGAA